MRCPWYSLQGYPISMGQLSAWDETFELYDLKAFFNLNYVLPAFR